jgi:hypothetical protein
MLYAGLNAFCIEGKIKLKENGFCLKEIHAYLAYSPTRKQTDYSDRRY